MSEKWYSLQRLLSYNALFNIVLSSRGGGKTFASTKFMIDIFKKKGSQSAYIRRNKVELDDVKPTFFNAIKETYPNDEFDVKGDIGYINGEPAIHFIALSTSSNKKSKAYPTVDFALFDEYIITNNGYKRYLKNEMTLLFDICETIFRSRDNWRIVFLSNSVSYVCPLFSEFKITPNPHKRFQTFKDGLICLEVYESKQYLEEKKQTRFAKLLEGTKYYEYAIENKVLEDTEDFINPVRKGQYIFVCSLYSDNFEVGVWYDEFGQFYIDEIFEPNAKYKFAIQDYDLKEGYTSVKSNMKNWRLKKLKQDFQEGKVFYSSQEVKKFFTINCVRYF